MKDYTVSEVAEISWMKPRTIQFWATNGALVASTGTEKAGTGNRRLFDWKEVVIALILSPLSNLHISIGDLKKTADAVRELFAGGEGSTPWWGVVEECMNRRVSIDLLIMNSVGRCKVKAITYPIDADPTERIKAIGEALVETSDEAGAVSIHVPLDTHLQRLN